MFPSPIGTGGVFDTKFWILPQHWLRMKRCLMTGVLVRWWRASPWFRRISLQVRSIISVDCSTGTSYLIPFCSVLLSNHQTDWSHVASALRISQSTWQPIHGSNPQSAHLNWDLCAGRVGGVGLLAATCNRWFSGWYCYAPPLIWGCHSPAA